MKNSKPQSLSINRPEVEDRARAIADMEGRAHPTQEDRLLALEQLNSDVSGSVAPEEMPAEIANVDTGDEMPISRGHKVPNRTPEDEQITSAELLEESVEGVHRRDDE